MTQASRTVVIFTEIPKAYNQIIHETTIEKKLFFPKFMKKLARY